MMDDFGFLWFHLDGNLLVSEEIGWSWQNL